MNTDTKGKVGIRPLSDIRQGLTDFFMLADIHFGVFASTEEWRDNIEGYFHNFFIPLLKQRMTKGTFLLVLGDVYDDRKSIDIDVNNRCIDIFEELAGMLPVVIISGNHDIYKKTDTRITSLRSLNNIPNLTMLSEPIRYTHANGDLFMMPYLGDYSLETKLLSENRDCRYMFMHDDIKSGMKFDNGRDITNGVSTDNLTGKVFSGHIHTRQEFGNLTYIGSPYHIRKSDIGNVKGVYHVSLTDGNEEFIENTYSSIYQKLWFSDLLEMSFGEVCGLLRNNYTDILVDDSYKDKFRSSDVYSEVSCCGPRKIMMPVVNSQREMLSESAKRQSIGKGSVPEIVHGLIDGMDITKERKERLKKLADKYQKLTEDNL